MANLELNVHPLFFIFGFFYALTGRIFIFVVYTLTAIIHEIGHSIVADSSGYRLNSITLMPFGAVVSGDTDMREKDQIKIALAGPFLNLAIGVLFVAVWWVYPETYAFTDIAAEANFSLALINLIPAYPLDGGRCLSAILSLKFGKEKSKKICFILGLILAIILLGLFVLTLFYTPNFSILLFSLFVLFGLFIKDKSSVYVKIFSGSTKNLKRGAPYKKFAVDKSVELRKILKILDKDAINEVVVFDGDRAIATLSQKRINELLKGENIYLPIESFL